MSKTTVNNKRIAKNTLFLYFRTILLIIISLYTSRVVLNVLGVNDFGIYNVVGGAVSMFAVLTGALSASISRYITYELGKDANEKRLALVFSTSIRTQLIIGGIIFVLGETLGLWFVNTQLNIPIDRLSSANWILHCSLVAFFVNLISVPYNALIIAHERMNTFAFVSILDAILKLLICYMLVVSPWDKLKTYAVLHVAVAVFIRFVYSFYCHRNFVECRYENSRDKSLVKEMMSFASFSFLNNAANILNSQGLNMLINIFYGVVFNAARGIATQVEGVILHLVNNFTLAVNPQITKSYAANDMKRMFQLVCSGSKYAYFMLIFLAIPVFLEAEFILKLWLKNVPNYTVVFLRLSIIGGMVKMLGNTGFTACMATGRIKDYSIWITAVGILAFPLTWLVFSLGAPAEAAYYVFIGVYIVVEIVRLLLMKQMLGFPPMMFFKKVIVRIGIVTPVVSALPILCTFSFEPGWQRAIVTTFMSIACTSIGVYALGLTSSERNYVSKYIISKIKSKKERQ